MAHACILSSVHLALDNRVFYREARSLTRAGYRVTLIAVHDRNEIRDGVQILALPRVPRWQRPRVWRALVRQALALQADIYHFHDPELLLVTPWIRWRTGKPTVYDIHEVYPEFIAVKDYMPGWLRYPLAWCFRLFEPWLARLQSGLIFADDQIAAAFHRIGRPKATLYNFPSRSFVEQALADSTSDNIRQPAILHLGGHERNRGTAIMIAAFERILAIQPEARLWLVGHFMPPELEGEVRRDAVQRGIDGAVNIVGRVPFERIGHYLGKAVVGWVPWQAYPKNEKNIPTKLFEYMAYALPVVSSDLASTRPFVNPGQNGLLVDAANPDAHAQAILELLQKPDRAEAMGRRGQQQVLERYNWGEMEKRLLSLYQELLT